MAQKDQIPPSATPLFTLVIAVYNDWEPLDQCLRSFEQQNNAPGFEVIIVDDGSAQSAPDFIRRRTESYPLTIVRQTHAGISAARNRGILVSKGSVLVFTDADCRFQSNCLSALRDAIVNLPQHSCFQLHLAGDRTRVVGRAEELRLIALQEHTLQPTGCIRYLNTAGFAIRRAAVDIEVGLFDPAALRAEDTLLLVELIKRSGPPFFVAGAVVQHAVSLTFFECLAKDIRSAWLEGPTFEMIAANGTRVRMGHKERFVMLLSTWQAARQHSIGRTAWFVLVTRQSLQRIVSFSYRCLRVFTNASGPANQP